MNRPRINSDWFLLRIGFENEFSSRVFLKNGANEFGRNSDADVPILSEVCSRSHCFITVNENKVIIKDKNTSNGTFVNEVKYQNEEIQITVGDIIGLGCIPPLSVCKHNEKFYVFSLQKVTINDSVELSDNESQHQCNTNTIEIMDDDDVIVLSESDTENEANINLEMSQYTLNGIKSEAIECDNFCNELNRNCRIMIREEIKKEIDDSIEKESDNDINKEINVKQKINCSIKQESNIVLNNFDDSDAEDDVYHNWVDKLSQNIPCDLEHLDIENEPNIISDQTLVTGTFAEPNINLEDHDEIIQMHEDKNDKDICHTDSTSNELGSKEDCPDIEITNNIAMKDNNHERNEHTCEANIQETEKDVQPKHDSLTNKLNEILKKKSTEKRKPEFTEPKALKKRKCVLEKIKSAFKENELLNKWKTKKSPSKSTKKNIVVERKNKLKELAATKKPDPVVKNTRTLNIPKVKRTYKNRGAFLADENMVPPPPKKIKKKTNNNFVFPYKPSTSAVTTPPELELQIQKQLEKEKKESYKIPIRRLSIHNDNNITTDQVERTASSKSTDFTDPSLKTVEYSTGKKSKCRISHEVKNPTQKSNNDRPSSSKTICLSTSTLERNIEMQINPEKITQDVAAYNSAKLEEMRNNRLPVSSKCNETSIPKTILKKPCSSKKSKGKVGFHEGSPKIIYFDVEKTTVFPHTLSDKNGPLPMTLIQRSKTNHRTNLTTYQNHDILTDITSWDPNWLEMNDPPINGNLNILSPMVNDFITFNNFKRILVPLMKLEIWKSIEMEYQKTKSNNNIDIKINDINYERRGKGSRFVYQCQIGAEQTDQQFSSGDLVIVTYRSENVIFEFLAYITDLRYMSKEKIYNVLKYNYSNTIYFTMEAAKTNGNRALTTEITTIKMKSISYIRPELRTFNAVCLLEKSPLCDNILHPIKNALTTMSTIPIEYKGYDALSAEQHDILGKIYRRCIDLSTPNIILLDGPPGSGKSQVIVNLIMQILYHKNDNNEKKNCTPKQILLCAQSNAAVDVITSKLVKIRARIAETRRQFKLVRFGINDKMNPEVQGFTLESIARRDNPSLINNPEEIKNLTNEKGNLQLKIKAMLLKQSSQNNSMQELNIFKRRLALVDTTLQKLTAPNVSGSRKALYQEILSRADIICTTLSSCSNLTEYISTRYICIIDEATQCTEPFTLIPLMFNVRSLVLVGDTQQLPAMVLSPISQKYGYGQSLFNRIHESFDDKPNSPVLRLNCQYRMHPDISLWPNKYFYKNNLINSAAIDDSFRLKPYTILSLKYYQNSDPHLISLANQKEADFVVQLLKILAKHLDFNHYSCGVITPYAQQRRELEQKISESCQSMRIPVMTNDSCQGEEKDIIIISNTRTAGIGFLAHPNRLNVALTRAKKCLILCGNFVSLKTNRAWCSLLKDAYERKCLHEIKHEEHDLETKLNNILLKK